MRTVRDLSLTAMPEADAFTMLRADEKDWLAQLPAGEAAEARCLTGTHRALLDHAPDRMSRAMYWVEIACRPRSPLLLALSRATTPPQSFVPDREALPSDHERAESILASGAQAIGGDTVAQVQLDHYRQDRQEACDRLAAIRP